MTLPIRPMTSHSMGRSLVIQPSTGKASVGEGGFKRLCLGMMTVLIVCEDREFDVNSVKIWKSLLDLVWILEVNSGELFPVSRYVPERQFILIVNQSIKRLSSINPWWWLLGASSVSLDMMHWAMPRASLQRVCMAIQMACGYGASLGGTLCNTSKT